jgi:hypothetical protein
MSVLNRGSLGLPVYSFDGANVGFVEEVGDSCFRLGGREKPTWVRNDAVLGLPLGYALLICNASNLSNYLVGDTV